MCVWGCDFRIPPKKEPLLALPREFLVTNRGHVPQGKGHVHSMIRAPGKGHSAGQDGAPSDIFMYHYLFQKKAIFAKGKIVFFRPKIQKKFGPRPEKYSK